MEFFENKFFLLTITFGFFFVSKYLQRKTGWVLLNPILLAIALLIMFLKCTGVSYETYPFADGSGGHCRRAVWCHIRLQGASGG